MELLEPSDDVVARIRQVIEEAAGSAIADGRAELVAARLADLVERPAYDCPVVLVTPKNPEAARILVEVQDDDLWWVGVADGPGSELHGSMKEDRYALLGAIVRSVAARHYHHGPCTEEVRRLFRPPRQLEGWYETFERRTPPSRLGTSDAEHPAKERLFAPTNDSASALRHKH